MSNRKALAVVAALVLAIGFLLAVVPTSVDSGKVDCGSALAPDQIGAIGAELSDAIGGTFGSDYQSQCEDRVSTQRLVAFPVAGIGALCLLFLALTRRPQETADGLSEAERSSP